MNDIIAFSRNQLGQTFPVQIEGELYTDELIVKSKGELIKIPIPFPLELVSNILLAVIDIPEGRIEPFQFKHHFVRDEEDPMKNTLLQSISRGLKGTLQSYKAQFDNFVRQQQSNPHGQHVKTFLDSLINQINKSKKSVMDSKLHGKDVFTVRISLEDANDSLIYQNFKMLNQKSKPLKALIDSGSKIECIDAKDVPPNAEYGKMVLIKPMSGPKPAEFWCPSVIIELEYGGIKFRTNAAIVDGLRTKIKANLLASVKIVKFLRTKGVSLL